jgi:hypothetical protein
MDDQTLEGIHLANNIICIVTAVLILAPVGIVIVRVNKRIPRSFMLNIFLYTLGIFMRVVSLFDTFNADLEAVFISLCLDIVELSLVYFII